MAELEERPETRWKIEQGSSLPQACERLLWSTVVVGKSVVFTEIFSLEMLNFFSHVSRECFFVVGLFPFLLKSYKNEGINNENSMLLNCNLHCHLKIKG